MTTRTTIAMSGSAWAAGLAVMILAAALAGCATPFLTADDEDKLRRVCGSEEGCAIVPGVLWREIERLLKQSGAWKEI